MYPVGMHTGVPVQHVEQRCGIGGGLGFCAFEGKRARGDGGPRRHRVRLQGQGVQKIARGVGACEQRFGKTSIKCTLDP